MKHIFLVHKPGECPNEGHCQICDGGLGLCTVCGCAEGSLATECPGYQCHKTHGEAIYEGALDFKNGEWVNNVSKNSPKSTQ